MSDLRSFGSNYYPCSESRKISIGVVVDSSVKTKPTNASDRVTAVYSNTKTVTSSDANPLDNTHEKEGFSPPCQITSPWVSTRSFYQKVPSSEAIARAMQESNLPSISNVLKPSCKDRKEVVATHSVSFFANQVSNLHPGIVHQKKFVSVANQQKTGDDGTMSRKEELLYSPANEACLAEEQVPERTIITENSGNATLRMKLWETLGAISSPNKQKPSSETFEVGANNIKPTSKSDEKASSVIKCRHHSDTIETDSDSPDHSIKRLVTRSMTHKKPRAKASLRKTKMTPVHHEKQVHLEDNVFSFEEGWSQRLCFSTSKSKKQESELDPYKMDSLGKDNADKTQQATDRMKTNATCNLPLLGYKREVLIDSPLKNSKLVKPINDIQEDFQQSPAKDMKGQPRDVDVAVLEEHMDQHEDYPDQSPNKNVNPECGLKSPAFDLKTSSEKSSPCSSKSDHDEAKDGGPTKGAFNMEGILRFKSFLSSKEADCKANENMRSYNCVRELEESPGVNLVLNTKEQAEENRLSRSPCEEGGSECSEDGSPLTIEAGKGKLMLHGTTSLTSTHPHKPASSDKETGSLSPQIGTAEKPEFVLHQAKKYQKGNEIKKGLHGHLEQNGEDDFASAVTVFALALERIKRKMHMMTSRKAADILRYVSEKIHIQLQNAESHIQADVGKIMSFNKSKRKRLETRLQEQQEQLKLIFQRFKEEVNQHLQDCKSTIEGLEAHEIEFKGNVEKQKVLHRKLLLEAEEALKGQLDDAQRRITSVQKMARENMLQLKYVIAESLKGGFLS